MWIKPTKIVVVATHSTDGKTNFKLIIYSHGCTHGLVDFEIVCLTRMVKNKYKKLTRHRTGRCSPPFQLSAAELTKSVHYEN